MMLFSTSYAQSNWHKDGIAIRSGSGDQIPWLAADDNGGAFVIMIDDAAGDHDVYVQRIDGRGNELWQSGGVAVCTASGDQQGAPSVSDGQGGLIIAWSDERGVDSDVYMQRVDASGNTLWTSDGIPVCTVAGEQYVEAIVSDDAGGAFVFWRDRRSGWYDIYYQRVDASGAALLDAGGKSFMAARLFDQLNALAVADGAGGAFLVWRHFGGVTGYNLHAQRIDSAGDVMWLSDAFVCEAFGEQLFQKIISDGEGGIFVAWQDGRSGTTQDIYAQRVDAGGNVLWIGDGVPLCTEASLQQWVHVVPDEEGGMFVVWNDYRHVNAQVYAQRVDSDGASLWSPDGLLIPGPIPTQQFITISSVVPDGEGGAVVAFFVQENAEYNGRVQRFDRTGKAVWAPDGVLIRSISGGLLWPGIVSVGGGAYIAVWTDNRNGLDSDAYAQRIEERYAQWGHPEPEITSVADVGDDEGGMIEVDWIASDQDEAVGQLVTHYSIWRAIDQAAVSAGSGYLRVEAHDVTHNFAEKALRIEQTDTGTLFWEWVANEAATFQASYIVQAPTLFNSMASEDGTHFFQVLAHTADQFTLWPSPPDSGASTDDLAPAAASMLVAQRAGGSTVDLTWQASGANEPDFKEYWVYRGTAGGFPMNPGHFLMSSLNTTATDNSADPDGTFYYRVVAVDVHGNESAPTNEDSVGPVVTGIGELPSVVSSLTVRQNTPNPFGRSTELQVGLPVDSDVAIAIYDVAGRRVFAGHYPRQSAGWRRISYDGRDSNGSLLPSGVYFYRVRAAGKVQTHKMVISR